MVLTDPFLQLPGEGSVHVVWMSEGAAGSAVGAVLVGEGVPALDHAAAVAAAAGAAVPGVRVVKAEVTELSRTSEDEQSKVSRPPARWTRRPISRYEARIEGLAPGRTPYRVVTASVTTTTAGAVAAAGAAAAVSDAFTLAPAPAPGQRLRVLLTSDHQSMPNTPANLQAAADQLGVLDAVVIAGDLVNVPDRASEWFDDARGSSFFAALQGHGGRESTGGTVFRGGQIAQHAPLFPAIGNHEVQGRVAGPGTTTLGASFNAPVPRDVAERARQAAAAAGDARAGSSDPVVRAAWVEDRSWSTRTYEEIFTLPEDSPGGKRYYATTFGDVRLVVLFGTRIWRGQKADPDPAARTDGSRFQEAREALSDPLTQGYGEFVFEPLDAGSEQHAWLEHELASRAWREARFRVVVLHEGPQGLGDNVLPPFAHPVRVEERDAAGALVGVRYEYPDDQDVLRRDVQPLLERAGADLVLNGHSHLWNRFRAPGGTHFLETSNTGNSYGAFHPRSGRTRPVPPPPWDAENYLAQGSPGGLDPVVPTEAPRRDATGQPQPFVADNDLAVFTVLDTGTGEGAGEVLSWVYDVRTPQTPPVLLDRFSLGR